ncbi:unnamed protein product [Cunninghamella blakesleeana]
MTKALEDGGQNEEEEVFDLVLVDINETADNMKIKCAKKNMYDPELKYISISYRWGEVEEQLLETPDYTAHITSFNLGTLINLCYCITSEPDLKDIPYLWIDAISVDQQNHARKKETILKMNQIYQKASYILAVPDMHRWYLTKHPLNAEVMNLIFEHRDTIHQAISKSTINSLYNNPTPIVNSTQDTNNQHTSIIQLLKDKKMVKEIEELKREIEALKNEKKEDELKKAYKFLAFLIDDWSNRAWVVSEYQIAREKYMKHGARLKYTFTALLWSDRQRGVLPQPFFSYSFDDQNSKDSANTIVKQTLFCHNIDCISSLVVFLESRFVQRPHLNLMIDSNATRHEDRFYAMLPSWKKYSHLLENKNRVPDWNIVDLPSVKITLYKILDDDDLWDKARLLYISYLYSGNPILPSFATEHRANFVVGEIDNVANAFHLALQYLSVYDNKILEEYYYKEHKSIFKQNLMDIQFNKEQCYLAIKADEYFIFKTPSSTFSQEELTKYSLVDDEENDLKLVYIPYFTYNIPGCNHILPIGDSSIPVLSGTMIIGNMDLNRWILYQVKGCETYGPPSLCSSNDYVFNVY